VEWGAAGEIFCGSGAGLKSDEVSSPACARH